MTNVWVVRSEYGKYTEHFIRGGYVAAGWIPDRDLSAIQSREAIVEMYKQENPELTPNQAGTNAGQLATFAWDIKPGDYIITPPDNTRELHYGLVQAEAMYYDPNSDDGCPFPHRRKVKWEEKTLIRQERSIPFQNNLKAARTVFRVSHAEEFLIAIGVKRQHSPGTKDPYSVVIDQILELDAGEFEELVGSLLAALGFEGTEVTGKSWDGGVDVRGELDVSNLARIKLFVQAKRYKIGHNVSVSEVRQFRSAIPNDGQGAFITTSDFPAQAREVAIQSGFPRIGLINGRQLVDLLVIYWDSISQEYQERLGLERGLVLST